MRRWIFGLAVALVALAAPAGVVSFANKTAESIVASGGLSFTSLEQQRYTDETSWESCAFMVADAVGEATTLFSPDCNVQKSGRWRATFTATASLTVRQVVLGVVLHNATGGTQTAGTTRSAQFRVSVGGQELTAVGTFTGASTLEGQGNSVVLTLPEKITVASGEQITVICERTDEALGCYFALSRVVFNAIEVSWQEGSTSSGTASHELGSLAYNASFSILVEVDVDALEEGTVLALTGGGGNGTTNNVYKGIYLVWQSGELAVQVAGKNGVKVALSPSWQGKAGSTMRVAIVFETTTGTSVAPRAVATGGAVASGSGFNFDNAAHTAGTWEANAPFDTWEVAEAGVVSVAVTSGEAWTQSEMSEQVWVEEVLVVSERVEWSSADAESRVRFAGGVLVIPAGSTIARLRLAEGSGAGSVQVFGEMAGEDTGEPGIPAFALSPDVELVLEDGARLTMTGRLAAPVTVKGGAELGAASAEGTLTLDALTLEAGAEPKAVQGCVEVYRCRAFDVETGAALRRWELPGFVFRIE